MSRLLPGTIDVTDETTPTRGETGGCHTMCERKLRGSDSAAIGFAPRFSRPSGIIASPNPRGWATRPTSFAPGNNSRNCLC